MDLPTKLTISRVHSTDGDFIAVRVDDCISGARFLDGRILAADFANALTGLAFQPMRSTIRGASDLGKRRIAERRSVVYTGPSTCDIEAITKWLVNNVTVEDGWQIYPYLRFRDDIKRMTTKDGDELVELRYSVYKYIDLTPEEQLDYKEPEPTY